jgi:hypothetical protein
METDDGDMAVGKLEKPTSLMDHEQIGLAQAVLPHARSPKQHGFSPGFRIGKDGECIIRSFNNSYVKLSPLFFFFAEGIRN